MLLLYLSECYNMLIFCFRFACTSIHIWHKHIIVAYGSGHIRIFSVHPTAAMLVEVAAHARWITALDLALDSGRLLSVGEDSLVRVWQIQEEQPMVCESDS